MDEIFLQILSGNHLVYHVSYVVAFNDLCDLENEANVTQFELDFRPILVLQCTKFGEDMSNIEILSRNHLSSVVCLEDLCDLENEVKVTQFRLVLRLTLVLLCTKNW